LESPHTTPPKSGPDAESQLVRSMPREFSGKSVGSIDVGYHQLLHATFGFAT